MKRINYFEQLLPESVNVNVIAKMVTAEYQVDNLVSQDFNGDLLPDLYLTNSCKCPTPLLLQNPPTKIASVGESLSLSDR